MELKLLIDGEEVSSFSPPKSKSVVLRMDEGDAFLQLEISQRELRLSGDGGATRRGTWEVDLAIPRVNEKGAA